MKIGDSINIEWFEKLTGIGNFGDDAVVTSLDGVRAVDEFTCRVTRTGVIVSAWWDEDEEHYKGVEC